MAVSDSREVVIEATPEEILDVIADVEANPTWSPQYQSSEVLESDEDGRPRQAKMTIKAAGLTDTQVIEYTWTDTSVSWTLVSAGQLKAQDANYTLTPDGDKTKVVRHKGRSLAPDTRFPAQTHVERRHGDRYRRAAQAGAQDQEGLTTNTGPLTGVKVIELGGMVWFRTRGWCSPTSAPMSCGYAARRV